MAWRWLLNPSTSPLLSLVLVRSSRLRANASAAVGARDETAWNVPSAGICSTTTGGGRTDTVHLLLLAIERDLVDVPIRTQAECCFEERFLVRETDSRRKGSTPGEEEPFISATPSPGIARRRSLGYYLNYLAVSADFHTVCYTF
jgi:hypothetical protein